VSRHQVTGPLTLIAFLAVILLGIYRRSVDDKRGLEYLYKLFSNQLTRNHFYKLAAKVIHLVFAAFVILLILAFGAWAYAKWLDAPPAKSVDMPTNLNTSPTIPVNPDNSQNAPPNQNSLASAVASPEPTKSPKLEITHVSVASISEFDITVRNLSDDAIVINRITVTLVKVTSPCAKPPLNPSAKYTIDVDELSVGQSKSLRVSHVVDAHKADRFLINFDTTCGYLLKVTMYYNKNDSVSFKKEI
jgi:hypothetical protein